MTQTRRRADDDPAEPIPERTSWSIRVPKSAALKIAASLIVTALGSVAATFLTMRAQVTDHDDTIAAQAVEIAAIKAAHASLLGRFEDHIRRTVRERDERE